MSNHEASRKLYSHQVPTTHVHWTNKYLDITLQSFFIQNLIKVSHNHFFSLEVAEIQAWRSEFNGSTWALSTTRNFFFLLFPSNLITSSTLLLFFMFKRFIEKYNFQFLCLKNRFKEQFSVNLVGPYVPIRVSKPCIYRFNI